MEGDDSPRPMTLDPLASDPSRPRSFGADGFDPRATRIPIAHRDDVTTELWVGGSYTAFGQPLASSDLRGAWLVDCVGELTDVFRDAAAACFMCVFEDIDDVPSSYERIDALARAIGRVMLGAAPGDALEASPDPLPDSPDRVYVLCKQGLNRSALVAGRILRELGATGPAAVAEIRRGRPGALTNLTFERLIHE